MSDTELIHFFHDDFAPHLIGELVQVTLSERDAPGVYPRSSIWVGTLEAYATSYDGVSFALRGRERNVHIPEGEADIQIVSYSRPQQILTTKVEPSGENILVTKQSKRNDNIWNGPTA